MRYLHGGNATKSLKHDYSGKSCRHWGYLHYNIETLNPDNRVEKAQNPLHTTEHQPVDKPRAHHHKDENDHDPIRLNPIQ